MDGRVGCEGWVMEVEVWDVKDGDGWDGIEDWGLGDERDVREEGKDV